NAEVCLNDVVNLTANVTGGSGNFSYQWQQSPDGVDVWTSISGATNAVYNPVTDNLGTLYYRVLVTDNNTLCSSPTSVAASVTVFPDATVSVSIDNAEVCIGDAVTLTSIVSG